MEISTYAFLPLALLSPENFSGAHNWGQNFIDAHKIYFLLKTVDRDNNSIKALLKILFQERHR